MRAKVISLFIIIQIIMGINAFSSKAAMFEQELELDWLFYHEQMLETTTEATTEAIQVNLPIEFDDMNLDISTYGTFIKSITIPEDVVSTQLGIELPFVYSAATVYVNGEKLGEVGQVGTNEQEHETDLQTIIMPFTPTTTSIEIAIQLSSFDHIRGGFSEAPVIGEWEMIQQQFNLERYGTIFVGTIIFVVGLATLAIGMMNRNEKVFLTFGLFSMVVAIRGVVAVPFLYHELPLPITYEMATRLEYITTPTCFALYAIFIYLLYNKLFSKWVLYFNVIVLMSIAVLSTFTEPQFFQKAFFSVFPFMIFFVVYNIWIMFKALKGRLGLAKPLLLGILFVFIGLIIDFLSGMGILNSPPLASLMISLNVLLVLLSLCMNYVHHVQQVKELNNELDEIVQERTTQLNEANAELQMLAHTDGLTGIANRHKFNEDITDAFKKALQIDGSLSLLMLDLDEFKSYNDHYGHVAGDDLLIQLTQIIQRVIPEDLTLARYGGEEFAIILPGYGIERAVHLAEAVRAVIEREKLENVARRNGIVTVSIGIAERIKDTISDERQLITIADERLYASKVRGRNRVTADSSENMVI